jgi:hypothetical protein
MAEETERLAGQLDTRCCLRFLWPLKPNDLGKALMPTKGMRFAIYELTAWNEISRQMDVCLVAAVTGGLLGGVVYFQQCGSIPI